MGTIVYIFSPQMEAIVFITDPSNLYRNARSFQNWGIFSGNILGEYSLFPSFSWEIFGHVTRLDQSRTSEKI